MTSAPVVETAPSVPLTSMVAELRSLAIAGLPMMFDPSAALFSFRVQRQRGALIRAGESRRYTAITLLGLAGEPPRHVRNVLAGLTVQDVAERLIGTSGPADSLGDLALIAWAARRARCDTSRIWDRIRALDPVGQPYPTVEVAWTLSAAAADPGSGRLGPSLALRLRESFASSTGMFPHYVGTPAARSRLHVSCFADLVYPVLALAQYGQAAHDAASVACAVDGAAAMCRLQGRDGQWWWHYDYRTGEVVERYPVYAVHQDSMAPMALFAAAEAGGVNFDASIARGLRWLWSAPELDGGSLIDRSAGLIWRKVARREPSKLSRYIQAGASRLSPKLRAPGLDVIFPPQAIDHEDRAYHLGWVLFAWPPSHAAAWPPRAGGLR